MMSDLEAKRIVDEVGDEMGLSPIERLAVRLVAKHETQNGAGWDAKSKPPSPERGAGSNNMGAITTTSTTPGTFFVHGDSRFDPETGKVVQYQTKFSKWATPKEGFRELARVLLFKNGQRRANVARALELGSILELATAMRMNSYFLGVKPLQEAIEAYRSALERRYFEIKAATGEDYFSAPVNGPKAAPGSSREASGSGQVSQSSQSVPSFLRQLSVSLPVLRRGSRGDLVDVLQFQLGLRPNERFDLATEAKLKEWQKAHGLKPDGVCGALSWAELFDVEPGDEDDDGGPLERLEALRGPEAQAALELAWNEGSSDDETTTVA